MVTQSKAMGPAAGARASACAASLEAPAVRPWPARRPRCPAASGRTRPAWTFPGLYACALTNQLRDPARALGPGDQVEDHLRQVAAAGDQIQVLVQLEPHHLPQAALVVGVQQAGHQLLHLRTRRGGAPLRQSRCAAALSVSPRRRVPVSPLSSLPICGAARPGHPRSGPETGRAGRRSTAWAHCMPRRPAG